MDEIYIEGRDGELTPVRAVPYESEDILQQLIVQHPDLLAGNQMHGDEPRRWLLIGWEIGVPDSPDGDDRFLLDHLFVDQDGIPTLVEVKRSTDTRIRREVVGQMLDYAANGLVYWRVDRLRSLLGARLADERAGADTQGAGQPNGATPADGRVSADVGAPAHGAMPSTGVVPGSGATPEEMADAAVAAWLGGDADVDAFWTGVEQNLRAGRVRMVFLADVIPPELQQVIEFLNSQLRDAEALGVEVRKYEGDGLRAYVPRVVGQTGSVLLTKSGPKDTRSFPELYEAASEQFKACLKRLEDWAERHELETRTSRKSRRFLVDGHVLVWAFPRWEAIQVDVWHLMETVPGAALAERIRTVCREQFGSTSKGLNWSGLDARTVVDQWERFEPEVLDPLLAGTRAPGTGEAEREDAGGDGDEPAAGLPESPDA